MLSYLQEVKAELAKVTWPTQQELFRLTFLVLAISVIVGLYLGAADFLFTKLLELVVK